MGKKDKTDSSANILVRIFSFSKKHINRFFGSFFKQLKEKIIDVLALIISIYAIWVAIESNRNQVDQFEKNSKSSDSLFQAQLNNSRELNDSLVAQIKSLQSITNKQLKITDERLRISKLNYSEQTLLGRPRISLEDIKITDTLSTKLKEISLKIVYSIKNSGYRTATNLTSKTYISEIDTLKLMVIDQKNILSLEPMQTIEISVFPVLKIRNAGNFYLVAEFNFYDEFTKRERNDYYYFRYYDLEAKKGFYLCKDDEKKSLRDFMNRNLLKIKRPLLNDEDN